MHEIALSKVRGINPSNCNLKVACSCSWKSIAATTAAGARETFEFHRDNPSIVDFTTKENEQVHCAYCDKRIVAWGWTSELDESLLTCAWDACRDKLAAQTRKMQDEDLTHCFVNGSSCRGCGGCEN